MTPRIHLKTRRRGTSITESTISLVVLGISLVGVAQMQMVAARSNHMAAHAAMAGSLAQDLIEQIENWDYEDPRLASSTTVTDVNSSSIKDRLKSVTDGRGDLPAVAPDFGDGASGATNANALTMNSSSWQGQKSGTTEVTSGGTTTKKAIVQRYWMVYKISPDGNPIERGKMIVAIARWKEPMLGWRQFVGTTFRVNPKALNQVE